MGGGGKGGTTTTQTMQIPPEVLARYNAVNARAEQEVLTERVAALTAQVAALATKVAGSEG